MYGKKEQKNFVDNAQFLFAIHVTNKLLMLTQIFQTMIVDSKWQMVP